MYYYKRVIYEINMCQGKLLRLLTETVLDLTVIGFNLP